MGLCGSVDDKTKNDESQSDEAHGKPDTRAKIDTVVVNWNMAGINENAYVVNMTAYFFFLTSKRSQRQKHTHTLTSQTVWNINWDRQKDRRKTGGTRPWNSRRCCLL